MIPKRGLIHQRTRRLLRPLMRVPLVRGAGGFSPSQVFAGSAAGLWLDPSDITTGFTDSAGLTQQTASGQSTGMRLDKRLGSTFGPELVTNGTFDSGTTGWTQTNGTIAAVGGQLQLTTNGNFSASGSQTVATVSGVTYRLAGRLAKGTCTNTVRVDVGVSTAATNGSTTPLDFAFTYTAVGASTTISCTLGGNETGTTALFDNISLKAWNGNHVTQATGAARPEYDVISSISSDFFDGLDDGYSTATFVAGTLTSGMDLFMALKRASSSNMIAASQFLVDAGTKYVGAMQSASGNPCVSGGGAAWSCYVDGSIVGAVGTTTQTQLHTAATASAYHVLEFRDLDLSAWTQFSLGLYTSFMFSGDDGGVILCPAQSTANRAALRKWLGAKVGLSL